MMHILTLLYIFLEESHFTSVSVCMIHIPCMSSSGLYSRTQLRLYERRSYTQIRSESFACAIKTQGDW